MWSVDRARRIAAELTAVGIDAWAETWRDQDADEDDVY